MLAGTFKAILSAFQKYPDSYRMIMACDMPLMNLQTLNYLKQERDKVKIAIVFESSEDGLPNL